MGTFIEPDVEKKIVSPLMRLLATTSADDLLIFLHRMKVQWTLTRPKKGVYEATIYQDGMVKYKAINPQSPKMALVNALAKFLVGEDRDFHDYWIQGEKKG